MLPGLLQRLSRIIRNWKERQLELSGEWKSSTTSCMERNSHGNQPEANCKYLQEAYDCISPRVQRLIVRSFLYLPFKVVYKKGIDIPVADALICVTPMNPEDYIKLPIIAVNMIKTRILMSTDCQGSFSNKLD